METRDGEDIRILEKLDVMEVSPVLRGSGVNTGTVSAKQRFADQLSDTLTAVEDKVDRAKGIAGLRAVEGRTLSTSNLMRIKALAESLGELQAALTAKPDEKSDGVTEAGAMADSLLRDSKRLGVDITD